MPLYPQCERKRHKTTLIPLQAHIPSQCITLPSVYKGSLRVTALPLSKETQWRVISVVTGGVPSASDPLRYTSKGEPMTMKCCQVGGICWKFRLMTVHCGFFFHSKFPYRYINNSLAIKSSWNRPGNVSKEVISSWKWVSNAKRLEEVAGVTSKWWVFWGLGCA